jgi:murein DD-endopeptidase MepM/ murein hydrolase activator NlpD
MNKKNLIVLASLTALIATGCNMNFFAQAGTRDLAWPLEKSWERPKLLTFGMHVTPDPENNPIDPPERFSGYHTALDLEILPGEEDQDVQVKAICSGQVTAAELAEGYGGVFVHTCTLNDQLVSVLYGHLDSESFELKVGDQVEKGAVIGNLAAARTPASGGNRKHLHLGIHKGELGVFNGYVQAESELGEFVDPTSLLPK